MISQDTTRPATTTRTVSRKLLRRVALRAAAPVKGESLEDIFPTALADLDSAAVLADPPSAGTEDAAVPMAGQLAAAALTPAPTHLAASEHVAAPPQATVAAWSREDEATFQALIVRRKAAGCHRRRKAIRAHPIRVGTIKPNPETIVAVIVGLVAEREMVAREELVDLMAAASYPHSKARPTDKGWCQGYVAGAIRNGFLAVAGAAVAPDGAA